jgi:hypothetical protein
MIYYDDSRNICNYYHRIHYSHYHPELDAYPISSSSFYMLMIISYLILFILIFDNLFFSFIISCDVVTSS